ncbi:MAG: cellulase family glycosylhydrolase [Candidatus Lokiarchaeota archaeon]|nr:cellulase family glycosylhydrolase [Candidatus Lokiarchaeota archaeon]
MVLPDRLRVAGDWFIDPAGRVSILRGVNLGGDTKVPYTPNGATYIPTDFSDHRDVSFIGRPFPLAEAGEHLDRLEAWGFNVLRLLTTWEAVEHGGPGIMDAAYLDYYKKICELAGEHGMYIMVDFHEDVWSRMTGGDGAPCWLFEKVGIDYTRLSKADAALVMQHAYDFTDPRPHQPERYPMMCWGQNERYLGNALMWTLFFGGTDFAPGLEIDGQNVQEYLQGHYFACQRAIGERVKDLPNVLGFDSLNEPRNGWIGQAMDDRHVKARKHDPAMPGIAWSPIDALHASHGHAIALPFLELRISKLGIVPVRDVVVNPDRISVWLEGKADPFQDAGAWKLNPDGSREILRNDFFQVVNGRRVNATRDYVMPFIHAAARNIQSINPGWAIFGEKDPKETVYDESFPEQGPPGFVNASHWYDNAISGTKHVRRVTLDVVAMRPAFGARGIQAMYTRQLARIKAASARVNNGSPTFIGEFGLIMDLDEGKAFKRWASGDHSPDVWKDHEWAFDLMFNAMDSLLLNGTLWNYTASNRNDLRMGDGWNQEDLSLYSIDQRDNPSDINSGGRALRAVVRPFARFVQGKPLAMRFNMRSGEFTLRFEADPAIAAPTVIFVPRFQYPAGFEIEAHGLTVLRDEVKQVVTATASAAGRHEIVITRKKGMK